MESFKKLVAPISLILLIVVAGLAFFDLRPGYVGPPSILDPNFQLWVGVPSAKSLMVWNVTSVSGSGDNVSLRETVIDGKSAAELSILQSGVDGNAAYAYLTQTIDGTRLTGLLSGDVGAWVLAEPCACNGSSTSQSVIFGVELDDGIHTLTYIFSDSSVETTVILAHRFVYLPIQPGAWTYQHFNVTREYQRAHWSLPDQLTFSVVFQVGAHATGWHHAYLNSFQVTSSELVAGNTNLLVATEVACISAMLGSVPSVGSRFSSAAAKVLP
jgi:hypothetical protein